MNDGLTIRNCVFAFKCTAQWSELTATDDEKISFCDDCQKEVHLCEDDEELAKSVRLNRCIAIYREGGMVMEDLVGKVLIQD
ncbi:hypothetical protein [Polynucleobacter sp. JS-JIR-II-b4]|uniref:hypothetical protein n=1 Tax=Polynucleobacter sp. JS-JIR-II-b4 TaxID=1758390 RepID=UPI001BFD7604|nr:hypothetical protein [Polynucleobacter sp. JS-JIR-II-b4]QWE02059.1 hypothetical protein ICV90_07695 [Polynucleobacter sp. JS-JIR-II-b4]